MKSKNQLTVEFHENAIPSCASIELDRLYGNIFSSLPNLRFYHDGDSIHTYRVLDGARVVTLFLFRFDGGNIVVLNEGIALDDMVVQHFARDVFTRYPAAKVIRFNMVSAHIRKACSTVRIYPCADDIVLPLPTTCDAYFASLGKATRQYIKRYQKRLQADFPSLEFSVQENGNVSEQDLRRIIELNRMRMASKHAIQHLNDREAERMILLAKERGMVCAIKMHGELCAGTVNFVSGDNYFLETIGHDPSYNAYGLGTLCCYQTIRECIARGAREYHFLWGESAYKHRLGGVRRPLSRIAVYRSPAAVIRHPGLVAGMAFAGLSYRAKTRMRDSAKRNDRTGSMLRTVIDLANRFRAISAEAGCRNRPHLASPYPGVSEQSSRGSSG
jgi:hypothetical protein